MASFDDDYPGGRERRDLLDSLDALGPLDPDDPLEVLAPVETDDPPEPSGFAAGSTWEPKGVPESPPEPLREPSSHKSCLIALACGALFLAFVAISSYKLFRDSGGIPFFSDSEETADYAQLIQPPAGPAMETGRSGESPAPPVAPTLESAPPVPGAPTLESAPPVPGAPTLESAPPVPGAPTPESAPPAPAPPVAPTQESAPLAPPVALTLESAPPAPPVALTLENPPPAVAPPPLPVAPPSGARPLSLASSQCFGSRFSTPSLDPRVELSVSDLRWCLCQRLRSRLLAYLLADPSGQPDYAAMEGNFAARCASKAKNPDLLLLAERSFKGDRVQIVRETLLTTRLLSLARAPEEFPFGPISAAAAPTADVAALVAAAQAALADLGYSPGFATGAFNAQTASALRAFQRDAGLPEDGELSARALALLEAATAPWQ